MARSKRRFFLISSLFSALFWMIPGAVADETPIVDHHDPVLIDDQLSLGQLVESTLRKYPDGALLTALEEEAEALRERGESWVAGALNASFYYRNSWVGGVAETGAPELNGAIELPLWNWGQRAAGRQVANQAHAASELKRQAVKLEVAGLIRRALWRIALENNRHDRAQRVYAVSQQLEETVQYRFEAGDLPRADLLLAQSESLKARSALVRAEAEQMHARKRYTTLSQNIYIPADFSEQLSEVKEIIPDHPAMKAINALVDRKKAELEWIKSRGSGQTRLALGGNSQKGDPDAASVETITLEINVPFGGSGHLAPRIAAANVQLMEAMARRDHFLRELDKALHEAKHALDVDRMELETARQRRELAAEHLKMIQLSFDEGETDLLDLLKIRGNAFAAMQQAEERKILLQRDIALYNQVVGELP